MPLVAWAALAYAVGLAVGLGTLVSTALGLSGAALVATVPLVRMGHRGLSSVVVLFAGGVLGASATQAGDATCQSRLTAMRQWPAELTTDAALGGVARARLRVGGCEMAATLFVRHGGGRAGDFALVGGEPSSDSRGLVLRDARITDARTEQSLATARGAVGRRIDRLFGADAPVVRALVIADMSAIPPDARDRFARAGLVHMLSVSGLHVAIIALALELLAGALRFPSTPSRVSTLVLLALYVAAIGAPPPAVRAAVMLGLILASRLLQRPTSTWAVLAVGSVAPLIDARTVLDLGWQLSVAGTVALVAGGALATRCIPPEWRGARRGVARAAVVSVIATVVTAPLVAWSFGRVALLGPVTNLLADPVMGVLQPVLFLTLSIPIASVQRFTVDAAHVLLTLFDRIALVAASLPFAAPAVLPTTVAAWAAGIATIGLVVACVAPRRRGALLVAVSALAAMIVEPVVPVSRRDTELHMIDVGQGDALALRTRQGRWVVIDAGRSWEGGDAGRSVVAPYIAHRGGAVALFVLSHPHADHVGGAASLFAALHPARFLDPGYVGTSPPYLAALAEARADHMPWQRVRPGDSLEVDEVVLTALAPDSSWAAGLHDANLASTVLLVRVGAIRMLLTGDAEAGEEEWLLAHDPAALAADVLKVGHHGSVTSTTPSFLAAVHPRLALVSVGAHNSYGHPSVEVLHLLHTAGAETLRTDVAGTVVVHTDGRRLEVEAQGVRWAIPDRTLFP